MRRPAPVNGRPSLSSPAARTAAFLLGALAAASALPSTLPAQERPPGVEYLDAGTVLPSDLPFSEAVRLGESLYLSGMVGVVPGTDTLVAGGIGPEARRTMENIRAVLEAHGSSLERVVKCTVFLADIGEWDAFNRVYREFFDDPYPARSALGASGLALDARVEVECIAAAGSTGDPARGPTGGGAP